MEHGTAEDWKIITDEWHPYASALPDRLIAHLELLRHDAGGYAVDRLEHSLQTATRAFRDGRDEEYVVCALIHDIGDILAPTSHAEIGAQIMKPYVSERHHWMLNKHAIFQGYFFFHHFGMDRNMRDKYRGHEFFEYTAEFCYKYDQLSFDPGFDAMPLSAFEPLIRRVLAKPMASATS